MSINLSGRALKRLRLPVVNYYSSAYQVMSAQAGDVNTRYLDVVLYDDRGDIDLGAYSKVYLQVQAYDGISPQMSEGWIDTERNRAVCRLTSSMLQYTGSKMPCNIWLVGTDADDEPMSLTSQTFYVMVYEGHGGADAEPSEDELTALQSAINDVVELEKTVGEAEANRQDNFRSVYIKYSFDANGYNYTDSWQQGQQYMGVANTPEEPENAAGYSWILISGGSSGGSAVTVVGKNGYGFYRLDGEHTIDTTNVATENIQSRADREVQPGDMLITSEGLIFVLDEYDAGNDFQKVSYYTDISGGHYTPSVNDNGNGTMTVSFTASRDGMPDINPVTVTIPKGKNGGHYSPSIHTITENSFKISFTPSGSDMPVVEAVTITLPTADDGVGIESIVQTTTSNDDGGENVITITLTNGNKSTFKVKNGSKGSKGDTGNGIKSIAKTSTSGLVDTYTITFTDNTTATFTVTNGDVGTNGNRGLSVLRVTTNTTSASGRGDNGATIKYKIALSTVCSEAGVDAVYVGDTVFRASVYMYPVVKVDESYVYLGAYTSIKGNSGTNGSDGTSVTVSSVTESTESGGSNVVEFSDGKTITVKNGKDGKTPINGVDFNTPGERADFKQEILAELNAAVYGYVDGNTINAKGNLAEGVTYTVYYELNGKLVKIGELTVGDEDAKKYTITWVNHDGIVLKTDIVTEGSLPTYTGATPKKPEDDSYTYAFSGWSPSVAEATSNATYTAQYTQTKKPTNYIPISTDYPDSEGKVSVYGTKGIQKDTRLALTGGSVQEQSGYYTTGFIPVEQGDRVYIENVNITEHNWINMCFYKSDYTAIATGNSGTTLKYVFTDKGSEFGNNGGRLSLPLNTSLLAMLKSDLAYIRIGSTSITTNSVIRIQRNGEWLYEEA